MKLREFLPSLLLLTCCCLIAHGQSTCRDLTPVLQQQLHAAAPTANTPRTYCVQLSPKITLQHALLPQAPQGRTADTMVMFDVTALLPAGTTWLGIGLSELGSMKGADMSILTSTGSGSLATTTSNTVAGSMQLVDSYAPGFVAPVTDDHQDLKLLSLSTQAAGNNSVLLTATWLRPLAPCDTAQDLPLAVGMPVHLLWAHGQAWGYHGRVNRGSMLVNIGAPSGEGVGSSGAPSGGAASAGTSHSTSPAASASAGNGNSNTPAASRGLKQQQGSAQSASPAAADATATTNSTNSATGSSAFNESDVRVLDLVFPSDIPPQETTYFVKYFKLPDDRKYHILRYEPVVGHKMLHHGVGYSCLPADEPKVEALGTNLGPYDRLKQGMLCEQFFMTLASNMPPWEASPIAALPFGAGNNTRYVSMELHYNNPELVEGQRDPGSGIRIYYTPKLREHDVGVLTIGQMILDIPPGVPNYAVNASICPSGCTARFKQPVNLMQQFFHMHGLGKSISTAHYRKLPDGTIRELTPLSLRAYDYDYQGVQEIYAPDAKVLLPGDSYSLQCIFDSTSRSNVTKSGPGTQDEMCFVFLTYWPAQADMGHCYSFGNSTIAACGADVKQDAIWPAFSNRTAMAIVMASGMLMQFPGNPAVNATPYVEQCSNLTVT